MHDIRWIRENPQAFDAGLARRGLSPEAGKLIALDEKRRQAILKAEQAQARRNAASKEIGAAKKNKDEVSAQKLMAEVAALKDTMPALEAEEKKYSKELDDILAAIPNLPSAEVPDGKDEHANVEHHHFGAKRTYPFQPKQHFELGEDLRQMDFETAAKLSGARFVVLKSGLARMERAIGQFFIDVHTSEHGYTEIAPPLLVRDEVMYGTAQLPKFEEDQFYALSMILPKPIPKTFTDLTAAVDEVASIDATLNKSQAELAEVTSNILKGSSLPSDLATEIGNVVQRLTNTVREQSAEIDE